MQGRFVLLALAGGGTVWTAHLLAGYFLVALGCPRGWPALSGILSAVTAVCTASALAVAIVALRARRRARRTGETGEAAHMLLSVSSLLAALFAAMVVLGGLAVTALPPCQTAIGGAP